MPTSLGGITARARQRLPFPSQPYAGAAPSPATTPTARPTQTPSTLQDALRNTTNTVDLAKGAIASTQPFLDNYLKPNAAGTTPFRQSLTNTKATNTANAYDNAIARTREKAAAAGFASNPQPITFGAEAGIASERAKVIADIPNQVNLEAQPVEFQAAQMQQNQSGLYNALANTQQGEAGILAQQKAADDARKQALTSGLVGAGLSAATPFLQKAAGIGKAVTGAGAGAGAGAAGTAAGTSAGHAATLANAYGFGGGGGATGFAGTAAGHALGLGGSGGFLGIGSATIPVIGGVVGAALLANHFIGQGRKTADKLTGEGGIQHAFEDTLNEIDQYPGLTPEQRWQSKVQAYEHLVQLGQQFAQKGQNEHKTAVQMFNTISPLFGQRNPLGAA